MNGRRIGVLAGLVVAVATIAGCGGGVKFHGQDISSDVTFLGEIEQRFHDDTAHGAVKVGDGAHCWLLRDSDSREIDSTAACGPVRHLGATENGVWDLYRFDGSASGKTLTVSGIAVDKTGATLPAGREPYRGDDAEVPANADALPAPEPPAAKPGTARLVQGAKVDGVAKPQHGRLVIPGAVIEATEVGAVKVIPGDEQSPLYRPADGEEFRAIALKITPDEEPPTGPVDITPAYIVRSGSQKIGVDLARNAGSATAVVDGQVLVASVPVGKDAELVASVAGVEQTLSVRTGERTSTNASAYYRDNPKVAVDKQFPSQTVTVGKFQLAHRVTFTDATVTPFDPAKGWAPAGKMWVRLAFTGAGTATVGSGPLYNWTPDTSRQLTAVDDKHRASPVSVPKQLTGTGDDHGVVAFPVAEDASSIQVGYGPLGTFAKSKQSYALTPPSGSYAFKRIAFRIAVPR